MRELRAYAGRYFYMSVTAIGYIVLLMLWHCIFLLWPSVAMCFDNEPGGLVYDVNHVNLLPILPINNRKE